MIGLNGGTETPQTGLGQAGAPRRSRPPRNRVRNRVAAARQRRRSGGTTAPPAGTPAVAAAQPVGPNRPRAGVSRAAQAGIGGQLTRRVSSGAIDQARADETAHERDLLEWAYGKDWRKQVGGGRGNVRLAREAMAKEPDNPLVRANYEALMAQRAKLLAHAKQLRGITTTPAE